MTRYVATINVPGYLPQDNEPAVFDTAREAWQYLADERRHDEDWSTADDAYSETVDALAERASDKWPVCDFERVGTVYGSTPGYDGSHDLGVAYCVSGHVEEES